MTGDCDITYIRRRVGDLRNLRADVHRTRTQKRKPPRKSKSLHDGVSVFELSERLLRQEPRLVAGEAVRAAMSGDGAWTLHFAVVAFEGRDGRMPRGSSRTYKRTRSG